VNPIDLSTVLLAEDPEPIYLVDNLYYQGQLIVMAGEEGVGKSFLQYNLAISIAAGIPFLGLTVKQGRVLYFDEENSRPDLQQYLRQIWRGCGKPLIAQLQENIFIEHFSLAEHGKKRFDYMAEVARRVQPALIIIDTATPCCGIEDENSNGEASKAIRALRRVKGDATMIILKHVLFSHDQTKRQTIRGAKSWLGESDGNIYHKLAPGKPRSDGLRNCKLVPDKFRAYGLRTELIIQPTWCGEDGHKGIVLTSRTDKPGN